MEKQAEDLEIIITKDSILNKLLNFSTQFELILLDLQPTYTNDHLFQNPKNSKIDILDDINIDRNIDQNELNEFYFENVKKIIRLYKQLKTLYSDVNQTEILRKMDEFCNLIQFFCNEWNENDEDYKSFCYLTHNLTLSLLQVFNFEGLNPENNPIQKIPKILFPFFFEISNQIESNWLILFKTKKLLCIYIQSIHSLCDPAFSAPNTSNSVLIPNSNFRIFFEIQKRIKPLLQSLLTHLLHIFKSFSLYSISLRSSNSKSFQISSNLQNFSESKSKSESESQFFEILKLKKLEIINEILIPLISQIQSLNFFLRNSSSNSNQRKFRMILFQICKIFQFILNISKKKGKNLNGKIKKLLKLINEFSKFKKNYWNSKNSFYIFGKYFLFFEKSIFEFQNFSFFPLIKKKSPEISSKTNSKFWFSNFEEIKTQLIEIYENENSEILIEPFLKQFKEKFKCLNFRFRKIISVNNNNLNETQIANEFCEILKLIFELMKFVSKILLFNLKFFYGECMRQFEIKFGVVSEKIERFEGEYKRFKGGKNESKSKYRVLLQDIAEGCYSEIWKTKTLKVLALRVLRANGCNVKEEVVSLPKELEAQLDNPSLDFFCFFENENSSSPNILSQQQQQEEEEEGEEGLRGKKQIDQELKLFLETLKVISITLSQIIHGMNANQLENILQELTHLKSYLSHFLRVGSKICFYINSAALQQRFYKEMLNVFYLIFDFLKSLDKFTNVWHTQKDSRDYVILNVSLSISSYIKVLVDQIRLFSSVFIILDCIFAERRHYALNCKLFLAEQLQPFSTFLQFFYYDSGLGDNDTLAARKECLAHGYVCGFVLNDRVFEHIYTWCATILTMIQSEKITAFVQNNLFFQSSKVLNYVKSVLSRFQSYFEEEESKRRIEEKMQKYEEVLVLKQQVAWIMKMEGAIEEKLKNKEFEMILKGFVQFCSIKPSGHEEGKEANSSENERQMYFRELKQDIEEFVNNNRAVIDGESKGEWNDWRFWRNEAERSYRNQILEDLDDDLLEHL